MSIQTWKESANIDKPPGRSRIAMLEWCERKFAAMSPSNLAKHGVSFMKRHAGLLDGEGDEYWIDSDACPLCASYSKVGEDGVVVCPYCPLFQMHGKRCDEPIGKSLYSFLYLGNHVPMLKLIRRALKVEREKAARRKARRLK